MERTGTGIGSLHFVSCLTEQAKNNRTLRVLRRNTTDSLSVSPKKNELPTKNPYMIDAKVENPRFRKWREPAHYRVFENKLDG